MGKGDKRSFKGKLYAGSYGVTRPRTKDKNKKVVAATAKSQPAATAKK